MGEESVDLLRGNQKFDVMRGLDPSGAEEEAEAAAARGDDCRSECRRAARRFAYRICAGAPRTSEPVTQVPRADGGSASRP
jgi:hypothetical protein